VASTASVSSPTRWQPISRKTWTYVGLIAIPLWATWPALSLQTWQIPSFECLAIVFLVASLLLGCLRVFAATPGHTEPSTGRLWISSLAFAFAMTGSAVFFLMATHYIPAAEANLIQFLWPAMIIALGALFGFFRLKVRYIAGIALGFAGAAVISRGATLTRSYMGIGLALLAGLSWALYCLFRLKWHETSAAILARGFGLAAVTCVVLHLLLESTVIPSIGSAAATVAVGIVPGALANWAWDHGFRRGNSQQLTVLAYTSPLCSALLLVVLGLESVTPTLVIGAGLIVMAALLSRMPS
jgi:drug/metabolite transporter (DMT)-like permease